MYWWLLDSVGPIKRSLSLFSDLLEAGRRSDQAFHHMWKFICLSIEPFLKMADLSVIMTQRIPSLVFFSLTGTLAHYFRI